MSEKPNLLIDIGNSQLKYTWYERATSLANIKGKTIRMECAASLFKDKPDVHFCSVKSNQITDEFMEMMRQLGVRFQQANTQKQQFGITNSYTTVTNMGSDRWLAMLAADALVNKDVLVIDAGTAITCDFIVEGKHIGGWIAPGLKMLRETVANKTGRVFDFEYLAPHLLPGEDTANCVANGALAQIVGMVHQARSLISMHTSDFDVIISGGDKDIISKNISFASLLHDNLVLAGLARICNAK